MRTTRNQVRVQDRMYLVLDPGAMPDDLVPPRNQTAETLRLGVRGPDLRQKSRPRAGPATKGDNTPTTTIALPVAFTTTSSLGRRLLRKPSSAVRVMSRRPSRISRPSSRRA